jgi:hypothetical protein
MSDPDCKIDRFIAAVIGFRSAWQLDPNEICRPVSKLMTKRDRNISKAATGIVLRILDDAIAYIFNVYIILGKFIAVSIRESEKIVPAVDYSIEFTAVVSHERNVYLG